MQRLATAVFCAFLAAGIGQASESRGERFARWRTLVDEARAAFEARRPADAEALYREVLDEAESLGDASLPVVRALDGLADVYRWEERHREAVPLYRRASAEWERLLGSGQPRLAVTLHHLGLSLAALGDTQDAVSTLERALTVWEATLGPNSDECRNTRRALQRLQGG